MAPRWRSNLRELLFGAPADVEADEARVANDLERSYYNYRLVKHRAEDDLVANPGFLWSSNAYWKARGGLGQHLLKEAELLDGAAFTDALVILSEADWRKTRARVITPWDDSARELLAEKYDMLIAKNRLEPIMPRRGFQVRFLRDGDSTLDGEDFQLEEGEFLTALIPHLYHGPVASSSLLAEIFVRLPEWEGELRKVGSLYDDQLGFTIGNHWLDTYQDRQLAEPALYLIHHYPDTPRLEHRLNVDQDGRYKLGAPTTGPGGEELQPLIRRADKKVVLEVMLVRPALAELEKAEAERLEAERAEAERIEAERAAAEMLEAERLEAKKAAAEKADLERLEAEKAGLERLEAEKAAAELEPVNKVEAGALSRPAGEGAPTHRGRRPGEGPEEAGHFHGAITQLVPPPVRLEALVGIDPGALEPLPFRTGHDGYPADPGAATQVVTPATRIARPGSTLPGEAPTGTRLSLGQDPSLGERTLIPDRADDQAIKLIDRGVLLQKIHFPQLMAGYTVNLGATGHIGLGVQRPFARIRVEDNRVWLEALQPGTFLNGDRLDVHRPREISLGAHRIAFGATAFDYRALRRPSMPGWPYLAELRRPPVARALPAGERHRIGRNRKSCAVVLPDRADQSNILWQPDAGEKGSVAAAGGVIPRDRVYTDSIMVAGEHAELTIDAGAPSLTNLSEHCQVFIRRSSDEIITLPPGKGPRAEQDAPAGKNGSARLRSGDDILLGNSLFRVVFGRGSSRADEFFPPEASEKAAEKAAGKEPPTRRVARELEAGEPSERIRKGVVALAPGAADDFAPAVGDEKRVAREGAAAGGNPSAGEQRVALKGGVAGVQPPASVGEKRVIARDEAAWSMDLRRPGRLVQIGWAIAGQATAGNHAEADLIIPENRVERGQTFQPRDYFTAFVRGDRARITRVPGRDVLLKRREQTLEVAEDLEHLCIHVARRDPRDHVDFTVTLSFPEGAPALPRPRARLLAIGLDSLNRGLFTWGLPAGESRSLRLGDLSFHAWWTEEGARLEHYLETYRLPDGSYREVYYTTDYREGGTHSASGVAGGAGELVGSRAEGGSRASGGSRNSAASGGSGGSSGSSGLERSSNTAPRWRTAPENGAALTLSPGSLLVIGNLVFRVES